MAFPDIFKKRKKPEKKAEPQAKEEKSIEKKTPKERKIKKVSDLAYKVLKSPHITEKATDLSQKNQYVFKVYPRANKIEIKKAIEQIYGVNVLSVKKITVPKKPKKLGKITGFKKGYKKAIVKIKEGQKIEITPR